MTTAAPSPFSTGNPDLQVAIDATSLAAFQFCPRSYQLGILQGWTSNAVDLEFGVLFASAVETFRRARLNGKSRDDAAVEAIEYATKASWDVEKGPWGGHYEEQWRCTGTEPYRNGKGNKAKCPYSHKGQWFPEPAPSICGECGSKIEQANRWVGHHKIKDRTGLLRLVSGYCFEQPEDETKGLVPYAFPDGTPAVELPFRLPLGITTPYGEAYLLCGYFDAIVAFGPDLFIDDNKTTGKYLGKAFFEGYAPHLQKDLYDLVGSIIFENLCLKGVIIEAAQVTKDGAKFGLQPYTYTDKQREELLREIEWWIKEMERCAEAHYWPMKRSSCWACQFKKICAMESDKREAFLKADFGKRHWNPLEER